MLIDQTRLKRYGGAVVGSILTRQSRAQIRLTFGRSGPYTRPGGLCLHESVQKRRSGTLVQKVVCCDRGVSDSLAHTNR